MSDVFAMGGYAQFLWPAYGLTLLAIVANVIIARRAHAAAREDARRRIAIQDEDRPT